MSFYNARLYVHSKLIFFDQSLFMGMDATYLGLWMSEAVNAFH